MLDETVETRRPWRGSPRSCVRAGAFLHFMGIILTVSKLLRYAPAGEYMCATGGPGRAYRPSVKKVYLLSRTKLA